MTRALSLADRWRRYWYLQGVELRLDAMPGRRRRAVLAELKANLEIAAAETGMTAALADLGRPVDLARQYLDQEPALRPHWNAGALAAGAVLAAWLYGTLFYTIGMVDALASAGGGRATGTFLGTRVAAVSTPEEISGQFSGLPWGPLLVMVLTFLLVSRVWNLLPSRRRSPVPA